MPPQRFYALEALIRPRPTGLVSCRRRPWGFALQGRFSRLRVVHPFGCRIPLGVGRSLPFRACLPQTVEVSDQRGHWPETAPLLGFTSLGVLPPRQESWKDSSSLELFWYVPRRNMPVALQSIAVETLVGTLASSDTPFEVLGHPSSPRYAGLAILGCPSEESAVASLMILLYEWLTRCRSSRGQRYGLGFH